MLREHAGDIADERQQQNEEHDRLGIAHIRKDAGKDAEHAAPDGAAEHAHRRHERGEHDDMHAPDAQLGKERILRKERQREIERQEQNAPQSIFSDEITPHNYSTIL